MVVRPDGYMVLRFAADNPGVWLFHCHIEWHVDQGLIATMVEAPLEIQKSLTIPQDHIDSCQAGDVPYAGNAAANTFDFLDLAGANVAPKPLPAGFTPRGIIAMIFSCIAALLGLATITWYVSSRSTACYLTLQKVRPGRYGRCKQSCGGTPNCRYKQ